MSERYTKLYELKKNLYTEGAPVIISAGNLLKDNKTGGILVQLKIKNIVAKIVKAAIVKIHSKDIVGNPIQGETTQEYLDLFVRQGEEFGQKTAIVLPSSSTRSFSAEVITVVFEDCSVWEKHDAVWEPLPEPSSLIAFFGDDELLKQYRLRFGSRCEVCPQENKDLWICSCGTWNRDSICYSCKKEKTELLCVDIDELKKDKDERLAKEKVEYEKKRGSRKGQKKGRRSRNRTIKTKKSKEKENSSRDFYTNSCSSSSCNNCVIFV